MSRVSRDQVSKLVGKSIYAKLKDGSVVSGKLVRVSGDQLILEAPKASKGKKVQTKAILPLALFDLLAIGTAPFAYGGYYGGGYGYGYDGFYGGWW
ncbi:50S ribosomal protein L33 [Cohnella sp. AR92]|uniref:50S ribosomal protein L33 n=1 Tax=Cohnella sp. AR92 TaxID=648716 RepID=UPI000F8DC5F7|nr:50S ribosomal protein L33 [Cohnella sp. AR92]RUS45455.1 50S ribosomal protein L33 [Cohnella sp. AR92]